LIVDSQTIKGAFQIIADVFGMETKAIMLIFLFFVTVSIESMVYSTSQSGIIMEKKSKKKKVLTKLEKEKLAGQLKMIS